MGKITDAEFEVVELGSPPRVPWWRRLYVERKGLLIVMAVVAAAVASGLSNVPSRTAGSTVEDLAQP